MTDRRWKTSHFVSLAFVGAIFAFVLMSGFASAADALISEAPVSRDAG